MQTAPSPITAIKTKFAVPLFLALVASGVAGNYFKYPIFLNIEFLFGSIFAMLVLQFFGLGRGIVAAAIIAAYTYISWNHPYAIIIMSAEVAVVGRLMKRRKMGLVMADTLYWVIIGMPLVYLFYHIVMHVPPSNTYIVMTKQAVNGIANALVARLIFTGYSIRTRTSLMSYREIICSLLTLFVLCPTLITLAYSSKTDYAVTDQQIRSTLLQEIKADRHFLESWVEYRKRPIIELAAMANSLSTQQMQSLLEHEMRSNPDYDRLAFVGKDAISLAFTPRIDDAGKSTIGIDLSDRPYVPALKKSLKPMLSDVFMGKIGVSKPRTLMMAPVMAGNQFNGFVFSVLDFDQIHKILDVNVTRDASLYTLLDRTGAVIITNRSDQKVMAPFVRGKGKLTRLDKEISQWIPDLPPNTPTSERWKKSYYVAETTLGDFSEWKLVLEQPVAPFQKALYDNYTGKLTQLFLILLIALALAEYVSRRIVVTLERLRKITSDLPSRLVSRTAIEWPESGVKETSSLISNFQEMSEDVERLVAELRSLNQSLEERIEDRTRTLTELLHELNIILETAPIGVAKVIDRNLVMVNKKAEDLFQYSKEELEFQTSRRLFLSDEEHEKLGLDAYPVLAQGRVFEAEQELIRKDGVHIMVRFIAMAVDLSDNSKGSIWLLEDITESLKVHGDLRKLHQELQVHQLELEMQNDELQAMQLDLGRSKERYFDLYDMAPIGYITLSTQGVVLEANLTAATQLGAACAALINQPLSRYIFPEDVDVFNGCLTDILHSGMPQRCEFRMLNTDGGLFWALMEALVVADKESGKTVLRVMVSNVSERKQLDETLQKTLECATVANNTMSRLLRTIAHEFRTPIGLLTGCTDILDRYWDRLTPEKRSEQNEHIRSAALQLTTMVNSIISYNQLGVDSFGSSPQLLDIGAVCSAIAAEVETVWSTGHTCSVVVATHCGTALLDETLFRRVVENLLTNAFRYTPSGGAVSMHVTRENNRLRLDIADTGIGIPDTEQAFIFDAFFRSQNTGGRRGMGLGLSIVHESLVQLGGFITVTSRTGEGTTMCVEIPVVDSEHDY